MKKHGTVHLLIAAAGLLATVSAGATTISITGLAGTPGTDAADGNPGGVGGTGGDGQDIAAEALTPGESHTVTVTGGMGGEGGDGGDGIPAGAEGGDGGDGGVGGDATARAIASGAGTSAIATAIGGSGGFGGIPGNAITLELAGDYGLDGFTGDALADAIVDSSGAGDAAITATAIARSNHGGDANTTARGTTDGSGAVTVSAEGSAGGQIARSATATAYGSNAGSGPVVVEAFASNAGSTLTSPTATLAATAEGHSTGGGDVTVEASIFQTAFSLEDAVGAPDIVLHDVVRGSTSGHLTLRQGNYHTGFFSFGRAGDVITSLHATNPGGGALSAFVAIGGGPGADTVLGDILATSVTGADVYLQVLASAGQFGNGIFQENRSTGSPPTPARIHAESNGGDVTTRVEFGEGNRIDQRDGAALEMVDVATGDTTGVLTLEQKARGGFGVNEGFIVDGGIIIVPAGSGGSGLSSLTKDTASSSLVLRSSAEGGQSGQGSDFSPARSGGDAKAIVDGSNSAGPVHVVTTSRGGNGVNYNAAGGHASSVAFASTTGDGNGVIVGQDIPDFGRIVAPFDSVATGGAAGGCTLCPAGTTFANGGDATSQSTGTAAGDSPVTVYDFAQGGRSGAFGRFTSGGDGGNATSTATALGAGVSTVTATSGALGGAAGLGSQGGNAQSVASAAGLGHVEAWARALGGNVVAGATGTEGSGLAQASADGTSGLARAEARTGSSSSHPQLRAQSEALVGSRRDVAAAATHGAALESAPSDAGLEGSSFFTSDPQPADADAALAGNVALSQSFAGGGKQMLALAQWAADSRDGPLTLSTDLELTLAGTGTRALALGAFAISVIGDGFESLSFSLTKNGSLLGGVATFATVDEVLAYFSNTLLDLGASWQGGDKLLARFDLELGAGTRLEMGLAYAVPEPGSGILLVFGLILFGIGRTADYAGSRFALRRAGTRR